jgi:hypothetical protein
VIQSARWCAECQFKAIQRGKTERYLLGENFFFFHRGTDMENVEREIKSLLS